MSEMEHSDNENDGRQDNGTPNVLVVDDDRRLQQLVAQFLRDNGFRVLTAQDGIEMQAYLNDTRVDLVVLDVMLPGKSGTELLRDLRRTSAVPVVMLTAQGDETNRIVGLELGADDYIAKPFNPRELLARIRAVLRRTSQATGGYRSTPGGRYYKFEGWSLDSLRRGLTNPEGVVIDLSAAEYDLLFAFVEAPQRILTRDQLLDAARNRIATGFDRSIDVQVSRLRRKIDGSDGGDDDASKIKTIRGQGYMFTPDVVRV